LPGDDRSANLPPSNAPTRTPLPRQRRVLHRRAEHADHDHCGRGRSTISACTAEYPDELRERAVRLVKEAPTGRDREKSLAYAGSTRVSLVGREELVSDSV
jgi:hypothetical protein